MATLIVTNTNDTGAGSLRAAVTAANASVGVADTIVFAGGLAGQTITLTSGELALTDDVTIDGDTTGDDRADITISGNNASRIFNSTSGNGTDLVLKSLTLTAGNAGASGSGGAIFAGSGSTLTILDSTIQNSTAQTGGGILTSAQTTISNSLIANNLSTGQGGGIALVTGSLSLANSTIDGNSSGIMGGGVTNVAGQINIVNSTISTNHAATNSGALQSGGGIYTAAVGITQVFNSVVADNSSGTNFTIKNDVGGVLNYAQSSAFGTAVAINNNNPTNLTNISAADIGLGALGNHGGTTATRDIISATSVLINAGFNVNSAGVTDANGNARIQGGTVDIGATEYNILTVTNLNASGAGSLSEAIDLANAKVGADHIVFAAGLSGTIQTANTLILSNDVTINGDTTGEGDPDIIIGSNGSLHTGIFVSMGATVSLTSLVINGFKQSLFGSAIENNGTLTLTYSNITNNTALLGAADGGTNSTVRNFGTLNIIQSVFSGNQQTGHSGAVVATPAGNGLNGNTGGGAATILNQGTLNSDHSLFVNNTSIGGAGSSGGNANPVQNGYDYTGGNGGNGGAATGGILNLPGGILSGNVSGPSNSGTGGAGGAAGTGYYGGANGVNGIAGIATNFDFGSLTGASTGDQYGTTSLLTNFSSYFGLGGNDNLTASGIFILNLHGGTGNDLLTTLASNPSLPLQISGGLGSDTLRISNLSTFITGGTWDGGAGIDTLSFAANGSFGAGGVTVNLTANTNNLGTTITTMENLIGTSAANDTLTGSAGNNVIQGLGGFDILDGGAGNDTLDYSEKTGNITLTLNSSTAVFQLLNGVNEDTVVNFENIIGGTGNDILTGDAKANILNGGDGGDVLEGGLGADTFIGGAGPDMVTYLHAAGTITLNLATGFGTNEALGDTFNGIEIITGTSLNDTFTGNGLFYLDGGAGSDTLDLSAKTGAIGLALNGGVGVIQTLNGINEDTVANFENIIGGSGNDTLSGLLGVNNLSGGAGNDSISGGAGGDVLDGGSNTATGDTLSYAGSALGVTVNIALNTASGGDATGDTIFNFENLIGSAFVDVLTGTAGDNVLRGGAGADTLSGGANTAAGDTVSYEGSSLGISINLATNTAQAGDAQGDIISGFENVTGSSFGDQLVGDGNANVLRGGSGNDLFVGGLGADTMIGGADLDVVDYSSFITGVAVNLTLGTGPGGDIISEIENMTGSAFGDVLIGDNGANTMRGGLGNDFFVAGNGADLLIGGADNDEVSYETATTGVFVNLITGTGANGGVLQQIENIRGSAFGDVLQGDNGANTIRGLAGNDYIIAGNGADLIIGGADNDTVSYETATTGIFANLETGVGANGGVLQEIENLTGSAFGDVLMGNVTGNTLKGGAGNDFIVGNNGSDALFGGADADVFRFETSVFGNDVIADYQDNADHISFGNLVATSFGQLIILNNNSLNVTVQIAGQSIVVQSVSNVTLTASDFLFV